MMPNNHKSLVQRAIKAADKEHDEYNLLRFIQMQERDQPLTIAEVFDLTIYLGE